MHMGAQYPSEISMSTAKLLKIGLELIYSMFTRRRLIGEHNLPTSGGCILVVNHMSFIDAPLLLTLIKHPKLSAFVANKYRRSIFFRLMLNWAGSGAGGIVWVKRGAADRSALTAALKALQSGVMLGIAPEGTRSRTGGLQSPKAGVAFLATKANVPIVPAVMIGTDKAFAELKRFRRPSLILKVGPSFKLGPITRKQRAAQLQVHTEDIMLRLAALLPEEYRGVYADHPRLKFFLEWAAKEGLKD
jgi:1-acyl-sn-glycerol-3-phosphate acyltransferase